MRRKPRPPSLDRRQQWQIDQGNACPCRGADDMCVCQNENPWPRPRRDYETEVRTLELQQQTDRQTIAALLARATAAEARLAGAVEVIEPFAVAYERWSNGGNLKGWQAQRMQLSVDATRFARAHEVYRAFMEQQG